LGIAFFVFGYVDLVDLVVLVVFEDVVFALFVTFFADMREILRVNILGNYQEI